MDFPATILIADDEQSIRFTLEQVLGREGYTVVSVENGQEAVDAVRARDFDLVLLDIKMPKLDGLQALKQIQTLAPGSLVIMMTAFGTREMSVEALRLGAYDYFSKPFDIDELKIVVRRGLKNRHLSRQVEELQARLADEVRFDKLIGSSTPMREVFSILKRVCANDVTVMIQGESGTGKELIAQAIHFNSPRRDGPFVSLNCAAIPENLLESELFGHERGAFTGAVAAKPGRFEVANKGTIFLDEIGDMPLNLQAKILRVLQERVIERVGGSSPIAIDTRVVAATHMNLRQAVEEGRFREDLFFRLNVIPVSIPPLRERGGDIMLLAEHFLKLYNQKFSRQVRGFSQEAAEIIVNHAWPGNVRELENAIQRAVIMTTSDLIVREDLPPNLYQSEKRIDISPPEETNFDLPLADKVNAITDRYEKMYIMSALQEAGFHRQDTADLLGISRKSLHNKMLKHGLFDTEEEKEYRTGSNPDSEH